VGAMTRADRRTAWAAGVLAALVFVAGVATAARHHAGYPINPIDMLSRDTSAEGRRELRALRRDPVLDVRVPGTRLRRSTDVAAGRDWKNADQPTEIRRQFALSGEPGAAVDAYRVRAEADGWRLHTVRCSFQLRATSVRLTRTVEGRVVTLHLYGYLGHPPPDSPDRGLLVSITGEPPPWPADGPEGAGLRRRDVHCLRAFDPRSADLDPPAVRPSSATAVCTLLSLDEARRVVPAVARAQPTINAGIGCRYSGEGPSGFTVLDADKPRAFYQDLQSPQDPGDARFVLLDEDTSGPPTGAWVDTRLGPVEIYGGGRLDARQLVALAELLGRR
jgi:hypothetical protein